MPVVEGMTITVAPESCIQCLFSSVVAALNVPALEADVFTNGDWDVYSPSIVTSLLRCLLSASTSEGKSIGCAHVMPSNLRIASPHSPTVQRVAADNPQLDASPRCALGLCIQKSHRVNDLLEVHPV